MRLILIGFVTALALSSVNRAVAQQEPTPPVDYLVICADSLAEPARQWAAYRAAHGRAPKVLTLSEIKAEPPTIEEITQVVKQAAGDPPREGFQLLLIGDCPEVGAKGYDPKVEIPWQLTSQVDSNADPARRVRVPTDNCYADLIEDPDQKPDIAVGRVPARTPAQVAVALAKVKAYESAPVGEWMRNLTFFAGEGRFGPAIDSMLENLFMQFAEKTISQDYNLRMTYANINSSYAYAPSRFSRKVIEEANAGALLLTYMGHGSWDRLDDMYVQVEKERLRYPILTGDDVKDFNIPDGKLPVMLIVACDTGYMDHKGECLAERVLFTEKAPVAVLASSRNSHPYANTLLQKAFISEVTDKRRATLGEAVMLAKRELVEAKDPDRKQLDRMAMLIVPKTEREELNRSHISMYNLTGDPGLRLRHPKVGIFPSGPSKAEIVHGETCTLHWTIAQPVTDTSEALPPEAVFRDWDFKVEARRTAIPAQLQAVPAQDLVSKNQEKREAAEAVIARNHALANDKTIQVDHPRPSGGMSLRSQDGKAVISTHQVVFAVPADVPPGVYLLKVFVANENATACGFTSLQITVKEAAQPEGETPKGD